MKHNITISQLNNTLMTKNAHKYSLENIRVDFKNKELTDCAKEFLEFIIQYQLEYNTEITSNQTVAYGFWLTKFTSVENSDYLDVWELDKNGEEFVPGVERTLLYWKLQTELCDLYEVEYYDTFAGELISVSKKALKTNGKVEGIRVSVDEDDDRSGWLLITNEDELDDDSNFMNIHLYHIVAKRPELIPFLTLPPGCGFTMEKEDEYTVWFHDEEAEDNVD